MTDDYDYLQFEGGVADREDVRGLAFNGSLGDLLAHRRVPSVFRVGWTGPWPPPERMLIAVGRTTGIVKVVDVAEQPPDLIEELRSSKRDDVAVTFYERVSASELPDGHDMTHLARGALYRPEA